MAYKRISPTPIVEGGTNATSMTTQDGVIYFDGSKLSTTNAGSATQALTSNGAGVAPSFQNVAGGSTVTIYFIGGRMNNTAVPYALCDSTFVSYWGSQYSVQGSASIPAAANMAMPFNATISSLYVNVFTNASTTSCSVTLYKNNSPAALTVSIGSGVTGILSDLAHTVSVVAGDLISFRSDQATTGNIYGNFSCVITG